MMIANYAGLPSCLFVEVSLVTGDACSVRVKLTDPKSKGCPAMSIVVPVQSTRVTFNQKRTPTKPPPTDPISKRSWIRSQAIVKLVGTRQLLEIIIAGWPSCVKGAPRVLGYQGQLLAVGHSQPLGYSQSPSNLLCSVIIAIWKREDPVHDIAMPAAKRIYDN